MFYTKLYVQFLRSASRTTSAAQTLSISEEIDVWTRAGLYLVGSDLWTRQSHQRDHQDGRGTGLAAHLSHLLSIVAAGRTYAFPADLTLKDARPWCMEEPPGRTVVPLDGGTIQGSAEMGPNRSDAAHMSPPPVSWSTRITRAKE
jgi:hypothetical protein